VLATPLSSGLLATVRAELEERVPHAAIAAAVEQAVAENLTGETILAEDLIARFARRLRLFRPTPTRVLARRQKPIRPIHP
jgi:hypothetical protein